MECEIKQCSDREVDHLKKLNNILNTLSGAFLGVFIGHSVYTCWSFKTQPEYYAMQSAPWYTSIVVYGAFTAAVISLAFIIKFCMKKYEKKK